MEKRLVNFLLFSLLIMVGFAQMRRLWVEPQPVQQEAPPDAIAPADALDPRDGPDPPNQLAADGAPEVDDELNDGNQFAQLATDDEQSASENHDDAAGKAPENDIGDADTPPSLERLTLGSVDPDGPYRMLVTCINRGAAIERIELSKPKYRDLEYFGAYIGHLALTDDPEGGCRINVVGAGTPAANAQPESGDATPGLRVGDVITAIEDQPVSSNFDFEQQLATLKPKQAVRVTVRRPAESGAVTLNFTAKSMRQPVEVVRPEPQVPDAQHPPHPLSYLLTLAQIGARRAGEGEIPGLPSLKDAYWRAARIETPQGPAVEFRYQLGPKELEAINVTGSIEVVKRYRLVPVPEEERDNKDYRGYHLDMEIEIVNRGNEPLEVAYRVTGPTGLPLEGWWYSFKTHPRDWGGAGARDVVWREAGAGHKMLTNPKILKHADKNPANAATSLSAANAIRLEYLGVDARYFVSALLPGSQAGSAPQDEVALPPVFRGAAAYPAGPVDEIRASRTDVSFWLESEASRIEPGGSLNQTFEVFAGPKKPEVLAQYGLQDCIVYGWFSMVAKPMTKLLHYLYFVVRNYGVAIILLTVMVRGCMFPLGRQQAMNARKMQELAPEMKKIADKYEKDMEKRAAAQRELFSKHNYNPLSGCLLMFFQLPIFIGLYRALSVDIELRQAPLIPGLSWCSNLSGPDMLYRWDSFVPEFLAGPTGWLGPYLNVLPLISVALFLMHQKLFTPPPTDEQQVMQHKVMKFMTLFMGVLFFKVPAGLCLYFITSSLWGLAERKLLPKPKPAGEIAPSVAKAGAGVASGTGGNGASQKKARARRKNRRR